MNDFSLDEQQIRIPPHEDEVCESRLEATKEAIESNCDRFIRTHNFEGIQFLDIIIGMEDTRRIYYGTLRDGDTTNAITRTLGYVEITSLKRLSQVGARVRIVCVWPPMYKFWEELCTALRSLFLLITRDASISPYTDVSLAALTPKKDRVQIPTTYDLAYRRLVEGEAIEDVFDWWCNQQGIKPSKYDTKRFREAMRRREKKNIG